jgi:hypothetical protein
VSGTPTITIGAATDGSNYSTVVIAGNLQVDGTTVSVNSTNLDVEDANITINHGGNQASADTNDAGLTVEMSDATDAIIHYDSTTTSKWKAGEVGSAAEIVTVSHTQTLTNKTLTSAVLTTPQINDASSDHQFVFAGAELAADRTVTLPALTGGDTFVFEAHTQTLTNKTLTDPAINGGVVDFGTVTDAGGGTPSDKLVVPKAARSVLDSVTRDEAALYYDTDAGQLLVDNGVNLTSVGSGAGGINYIESPDAESGTTGWATYKDAAATTPANGVDGSSTLAWTSQSGTVLRGTKSFQLAKPVTDNNQGEGVAYPFTIDAADKSRLLSISFDFSISDTDYTAGDVAVYIYDVTNATLITPSQTSVPAGAGRFEATWVSTTSTSYRLILHVTETGTTAWDAYFDNFRVGPDQAVFGPSVGEWETITSTWSNVTWSSQQTAIRRSGSSMEIKFRGVYSSSTPTTPYTMTLPNSLTADTTQVTVGGTGTTTSGSVLGVLETLDGPGTARTIGIVELASTTTLVFRSDGLLTAHQSNTPMTWAAGDVLAFTASVPIAQWAGDTTHLAAARVEYVSETSGVDVFGPAGSLVPNQAAAINTTTYTVSFQTPPQPSDDIILELFHQGRHWVNASDVFPFTQGHNGSSTNYCGMRFYPSGTNTFVVEFGNQGTNINADNANAGAATWATQFSAGSRWRLRKSSPHAPAGIQLATSSTPGLMPLYESGSYSPTITNVANVGGTIGSSNAFYTRIGNMVSVVGYFTSTSVTHSTLMQVGISLPIASNFATSFDAFGVGSSTRGSVPWSNGGQILSDSANDRVTMSIHESSGNGSTHEFSYSFTYVIK